MSERLGRIEGASTALVTGITGQDGAYLARSLMGRGVRVVGTRRAFSGRAPSASLAALGIAEEIEYLDIDLEDPENVSGVVREAMADRVFHLAAMSSVASAWEDPVGCARANAIGTLALIEAVRVYTPEARFVHASSSEIFAPSPEGSSAPIDETSPFGPVNPYGAAKLHAHLAVTQAREARGLHASNAILFSHESPLRDTRFVTRKITTTLARIANGSDEVLGLGNLDAQRDWSHAEDVVEALVAIAEAERANDYVIASGTLTSVREFVEEAARTVGLSLEWNGEGIDEVGVADGRTVVRIDERFFRPAEAGGRRGDPSRIETLGWRAERSGRALAREIAEHDMRLASKGLI